MNERDEFNVSWCNWLLGLPPRDWLAIKQDELWYFDAARKGLMSCPEIRAHARAHHPVDSVEFVYDRSSS